MNRFGRIAQQYWTTYLPGRVAAIPLDQQEAFFADLGRAVEDEIVNRLPEFEGRAAPQESYEQTVGRLKMGRLRAQEAVLAELVYLPKEPGTENLELPADLPPQVARP